MTDLKSQFEKAARQVKQLAKQPDSDTMLRLYALFKQATQGDVAGTRPGPMDFVGRAKYDAWAELKGMSQREAMQAYIDFVESLQQ